MTSLTDMIMAMDSEVVDFEIWEEDEEAQGDYCEFTSIVLKDENQLLSGLFSSKA